MNLENSELISQFHKMNKNERLNLLKLITAHEMKLINITNI